MAWYKQKSMNISKLQLLVAKVLGDFVDPVLGLPIKELSWLDSFSMLPADPSETATSDVAVGPQYQQLVCWGYPLVAQQASDITAKLQQLLDSSKLGVAIFIKLKVEVKSRSQMQPGQKSLPKVKNMIAIASGKGGVGKSTTASHFAYALRNLGVNTGLLDADIYGPNQPQILGSVMPRPDSDKKKFIPVTSHGIQAMSIGYLLDQKKPLIWRGPMVSGALQQLMNDTLWDPLDYLIIDMPPGTGDVQLTLSKKYALSGAIIVTTPHSLALQDARRAIEMFLKVKVPVLGIIENMSSHYCEHCGKDNNPFGKGGAALLAKEYDIPLLAEVPLSPHLSAPLTGAVSKNDPCSKEVSYLHDLYFAAAQHATATLAKQKINYAAKFPQVVVEGG